RARPPELAQLQANGEALRVKLKTGTPGRPFSTGARTICSVPRKTDRVCSLWCRCNSGVAVVEKRRRGLVGRGRCLTALGKSGAETPLREARELFASMAYESALAEVDELLAHAEAAAAV